MIECVAGIIIGMALSGAGAFSSLSFDGLTGLIVGLVLADELIAALKDTERKILTGVLKKLFFCFGAIWIEQWCGAPLTPLVVMAITWSIYRGISGTLYAEAGAR